MKRRPPRSLRGRPALSSQPTGGRGEASAKRPSGESSGGASGKEASRRFMGRARVPHRPLLPDSPEPVDRRTQEMSRARGRHQAYLKARRQRKRILVMCSRLRFLVQLCFLLLLCLLLWQFVAAGFWTFDAPRVSVENTRLLTREELTPVARTLIGSPITQVDPQAIEAWLKRRYPLLESVTVRRALFPARLTLFVSEKNPLAEFYAGPTATRPAAILTATNDVVSLAPYRRALTQFPQPGLLRVEATPGQRLPTEVLRRMREIAAMARAIPGLNFQAIDIRSPQQTTLRFAQTTVHLGALDVTSARRLARLQALVPLILAKGPEIDAVNLQWLNQVTFHRADSREDARQRLEPPAFPPSPVAPSPGEPRHDPD